MAFRANHLIGLGFNPGSGFIKAQTKGTVGGLRDAWRALPTWGKVLTSLGGAGLTVGSALGLGGILAGNAPGDTYSYRINKNLNNLVNRIKLDETASTALTKGFATETGKSLAGLLKDTVAKGYDSLQDTLGLSPVRHKIFETLKQEDPILRQTSNQTLQEAYHTMAKVAPSLSTDKNAVRSLLRIAATSGGGLDFATIKGLADAEAAVKRAKKSE